MESTPTPKTLLHYRGRPGTEGDVRSIRALFEANPGASRRSLSKKLCELWNWEQANGSLRDMLCRGLMLQLHRCAHIELPPRRRTPRNPLIRCRRPPLPELAQSPLHCQLDELGLGRMRRGLSKHWQELYAHGVYFAETFVDPTLYAGTCYRAANWVFPGQTTGGGKDDHSNRPNRPLKQVLGLPLCKDFRKKLLEAR